ncbi:hypothetical protein TIFTF001_050006 [Ficus carica]|uniref:DUF1985 domain-containing protein n=1 Tax=Ficus carica TaxID=3494 RepID=A0AA88CW68_FICCA|nr:hypothetical protein TIFTF001_050006 [Ficus carica]
MKETNGSTENSSDEEADKEDHDISRMILTSDLQELPPLILSEYFSAKVTVCLYTDGGPSEDEIKTQEEKNELKNKYWSTKKSVLLADVAKKLKELSVTKVRTKDRVKLAFLYMVAGFLTSFDNKKTLKYIKADLVAKFNKYSSSYNFYGCPWIFQIWAFEAMPKLCEMMAKKLALNEKNKNGPWWLCWQNVQNPIGTSFDPCLEAMRSAEILTNSLQVKFYDFRLDLLV